METARGGLAPKPAQRPPLFVSPGHERRCQNRTPSKNELMPLPLNSRTMSFFPPPHQLLPPSQTQVALFCLPHHLPWERGTASCLPYHLPSGRLCTPKAPKEPDDAPMGTGGYEVHWRPQGIPQGCMGRRQVPEARQARFSSAPRPSLARNITPRGAAGALSLGV